MAQATNGREKNRYTEDYDTGIDGYDTFVNETDLQDNPLLPKENITTYYYCIQVKDSQTDEKLSSASASWTWNSNTGLKSADSQGKINITITSNDAPSSLTVTVSANGYDTKTNVSISRQTYNLTYTTVTLDLTTTTYYYTAHVSDGSSSINDAEVNFYQSNGSNISIATLTTGFKGDYIFSSTEISGTLYAKASKNGYVTSDYKPVESYETFYDARENSTLIVLTVAQTTNYYYTIAVKDNNNNPIPNARVKLYSDSGYVNPLVGPLGSPVNITSTAGGNEVFGTVQEIMADILGIYTIYIHKEDALSQIPNYESLLLPDITSAIENKFGLTIPNNTFDDNNTIEDIVYFIQQYPYGTTKYVPITIFTTDTNGLINCFSAEYYTYPTTKIFAKGLSLPDGYTWGESDRTSIEAKSNSSTPGGIITVTSNEPTIVYYHNQKVVDTITGKPISGATITYTYDGTVLTTQTTDSNGFAGIGCHHQYIDITVYKDDVYNEYSNMGSTGFTNSSQYSTVNITPKHTIQVVYGNWVEPADQIGHGVKDISVRIYYVDDAGNNVNKGLYRTNANGYIDTLSNNFYTTGNRYKAVVVKYKVNNNSDKKDLTQYIVRGNTIITLPEPASSGTDENQFDQFNEMSINNLKNNLKKGNIELDEELVESNKVSYGNDTDYRINIVDPESINVYDIFTSTPVVITNNNRSIIGSVDIEMKKNINNLRLKTINRYSGYYNPIFKDVVFYNNLSVDREGNTKINCPFSNVAFDVDYKDNYGQFGIINNIWFHKANEDKDVKIINTLTPFYPMTGQYTLDYKDYNIFSSSWDLGYYTKQVDVETSKPCVNISSMKNGLCMFGSKYLNVPNDIEICGFSLGNDSTWAGEWNDDWITNPDGCPGEVMFKEVNNNSVDFYFFLKKRIIRYFSDKLKSEFGNYISASNPNFSFGKEGIEDDIEEYVTKNVLKLYKLEKVRFFIKRVKRGIHNNRIENDYTKYLSDDVADFKRHGFEEIKTVTLSKVNRDDFDRKLVYNLRNGYQEDFGFCFLLKKI